MLTLSNAIGEELAKAHKKFSFFFTIVIFLGMPLIYFLFPYLPWEINKEAGVISIAVFSVFVVLSPIIFRPKHAMQMNMVAVTANLFLMFALSCFTGYIRSPINMLYMMVVTFPFFLVGPGFGLTISIGAITCILLETIFPVWNQLKIGDYNSLIPFLPFSGFYILIISYSIFIFYVMSTAFRKVEQTRAIEREQAKFLAQAVKDLKQLNSEKDQFIRLISHHLRTPLSRIRWALTSKGDKKECMKEIENSSNEVIGLLDKILNISDWELRKVKFEKSIDISDLLLKAVKSQLTLSKKNNIKITKDIDTNALIEGNSEGLSEVLKGVISNAILYNNPNGTVEISLKKEKNGVDITVKDNGIGISEEDQKGLFTVFFRGSNVKSTDGVRQGTTLFIADKIVRAHLGKITVKSKLGKGTQVSIFLPYFLKERI